MLTIILFFFWPPPHLLLDLSRPTSKLVIQSDLGNFFLQRHRAGDSPQLLSMDNPRISSLSPERDAEMDTISAVDLPTLTGDEEQHLSMENRPTKLSNVTSETDQVLGSLNHPSLDPTSHTSYPVAHAGTEVVTKGHGKRPLPVDFDVTDPTLRWHPRCEFRKMANPPKKVIPCAIAVRNHDPIGHVKVHPTDKIQPQLRLECGKEGPPRIILGLNLDNGQFIGEINWGIGDMTEGRWHVHELAIDSVAQLPTNRAINHPIIIDGSRDDDRRVSPSLMCITLGVSYNHTKWCKPLLWQVEKKENLSSWSILFQGYKDYTIRIWFLIPPWFHTMDQKCLQVLRDLFVQRRPTLYKAVDVHGNFFYDFPLEHPAGQRPWGGGKRFKKPRIQKPVQAASTRPLILEDDATDIAAALTRGSTAAATMDMDTAPLDEDEGDMEWDEDLYVPPEFDNDED